VIKASDFTYNGVGIIHTTGPMADRLAGKYAPLVPVLSELIGRDDTPLDAATKEHASSASWTWPQNDSLRSCHRTQRPDDSRGTCSDPRRMRYRRSTETGVVRFRLRNDPAFARIAPTRTDESVNQGRSGFDDRLRRGRSQFPRCSRRGFETNVS
jgi:hypothetical protein